MRCPGVDWLRQVGEDGRPTESSVHEDGDKILRGQATHGLLGGWLECGTFAAWSAAEDDPPVYVETKEQRVSKSSAVKEQTEQI